jgi:hypothetical protein
MMNHIKTTHGNFEYKVTGFNLAISNKTYQIEWREIEKLVVYKIDLLTFDEICLDIVLPKTILTITEEIPGWWSFLDQVELQFPATKDSWTKFRGGPAFDRSVTTIYQRS